ncbi:hypothetical protein PENTCL1PPCAC_1300, partial [Pristionchus entomophagus]
LSSTLLSPFIYRPVLARVRFFPRMSERKTSHEKFRNLFKSPSREQMGVGVAPGSPDQSKRSRNSSSPYNSKNGRNAGTPKGKGVGVSSKSAKSHKKTAIGDKSSSKNTGTRKKASTNQPPSSNKPESSRHSNRRKSPHRPAKTPSTPTTPPTAGQRQGSRATPQKPSVGAPPPPKFAGQDIQEKTQMCNTVFENDGLTGGTTTTGGGEGHIELAAGRITERKLQWKKEEKEHTTMDPKQPETSGSKENSDEEKKKSKEDLKHEVHNTITIFENDDQNPAPVKEEKPKLQ